MVLNEAFRYQNYLSSLFLAAEDSITDREHCLKVVKTHFKNKENPDISDPDVEEVVVDDYFNNDNVLMFMTWLIEERGNLAAAISRAKRKVAEEQGFDIDVAVECNKYKQRAARAVQSMLSAKGSVRKERGTAYRFNSEGTQAPYYYEIEVRSEDAYDREKAKAAQKRFSSTADKVSTQIDAIMVTTEVDYTPCYDVNDSFEEVMGDFIKTHIEK